MFRRLNSKSIYKKDKTESVWLLWAFCFTSAQSTTLYHARNCSEDSCSYMDSRAPTSQDASMLLQPISNSCMFSDVNINRDANPPNSSVCLRIFHYSYIPVITLEQTFPAGKLCHCRFVLSYLFFVPCTRSCLPLKNDEQTFLYQTDSEI